MSPESPAEKAVGADLDSTRFQVGVKRGHWRRVSYQFPLLVLAVTAIEPDGKASEYFFRFELSGFPGTAPELKIWDCETDAVLAVPKRPKGSNRVSEAFKTWGNETVYRPWDRQGSQHNNWATSHPELAWHPKRDLTFILEDLHGLLTSNAAAHRNRPAA